MFNTRFKKSVLITYFIFAGLQISANLLHNYNLPLFWVNSVFYLILLFFAVLWIYDGQLKEIDIYLKNYLKFKHINRPLRRYQQIYLHSLLKRLDHFYDAHHLKFHLYYLVLPVFLYCGTLGMLFFGYQLFFREVLIALSSLFMLVLLINIHLVYENQMAISLKIEQIFNFIKIYVLFLCFGTIYGFYYYFEAEPVISPLNLLLFNFSLTVLFIFQAIGRKEMHSLTSNISAVVSGIIIMLASLVVMQLNLPHLYGTLALTALYNLVWGFTHHLTVNKINRKIILEYAAVLMIIMILIFTNDIVGTVL